MQVTFTQEALPCCVNVGLEVLEVTPYAAPVCEVEPMPEIKTHTKFHKQTHPNMCTVKGEGGTGQRGVVPLPPPQTALAPSSTAWLRCPKYRTRLLASQYQIKHIHAI